MMNSKSQGFTLVELLISLLIGTVVLGAVYTTVASQENTNRQQIAVVTTEQNNRMALELLSNELREVSAGDGDIYAATSNSIAFRAMRKAGIICSKDGSGAWINVTVYGEAFVASDSVLIFLEGASNVSMNDDSWIAGQVSTINSGMSCAGYPNLGSVVRLNFGTAAVAAADSGGLVRSFVPVSYNIADSAGTGTANLYRVENGVSVPVVESLRTVANNGLLLRYFDRNGTEITPSTAALRAGIMRIQITVSGTYIGGGTRTQRMFTDSLTGQVYLRGNEKTS